MITGISRRRLLQSVPAAAAAAMIPSFARAADTIKIGFVSPQTGPLAAFADPDKFTIEQVKKMTAGGIMIGGTGTIEGPIIGTLLFWVLNKFFADYGSWYLIGLGVLAIAVTLRFKQGLWGMAQSRFGWSLFSVKRILKR